MSYTIYYSDPAKFNFPIVVQDNTKYNSVGTGGLTLVGRDYPGYGQAVAENFIHVLENSASTVPPVNPIEGQLWFDTSDPANKKLRINDGAANNTSWRPINGLHQSPIEPSQVTAGDIWVDTTDNQLKIYNGSDFILVGPNAKGVDFTGPVPETVPATDGNSYEVILNYVQGRVVSIISNSRFTPNPVISGFVDVEVGVTLSTDDFGTFENPRYAKFYGTSRNADNLILSTGEIIPSSTVLRNNTDQILNGTFRISKAANALSLGTSPTFIMGTDNSGVSANFNNEIPNSTFNFTIKNSLGVDAPILTMGGTGRQVIIKSSVNSDSTITGALQISGGIGIGRDVFVGGALYTSQLVADGDPGSNGQILVTDGTRIYWSNFNANAFTTGGFSTGIFTITNVEVSSSPTTGALQVYGGVGIGGQVNIGSVSTATTSSGALRVDGGVSIGGGLYVAGEIIANKLTIQLTTVTTTQVTTDDIIQTKNVTASTGTTTGALIIAGGVGVGGSINVGGNVNVTGIINATIAGVATSATNVVGGTTGSILVQSAAGISSYIAPGVTGQFLRSGGTTATFVNTSTMYVDSAVRAEQFRTARTITFTGDVTGSFVLDGTQNTGTALTIQANSIALGSDTVGDYISTGTTAGYGISGSASGEGTTFTVNSNATSSNAASTIVFRDNSNNFSAGNITAVQFNGGGQGLTNIPGLQIDDGSIRNRALTSSTIGIGAGSAIGVSRATINLGDAFTITNLGVQTLTGSAYLAVSTSTGTVTISNNGVQTLTGSAYLAVSTSTGTVTITNNGVQTLTGSAYLAVSASTGTVTITNQGVRTISVTGALGVDSSTGTITITDLGVRSVTGSAYLAVSTSTGTVTISNNGVQTLTGSAYLAVSASTGTVTITNNGVQTISVAGALGVSASTGTVTITSLGVASLAGSSHIAVSTSTGTVTISNNGVRTLTGSAYIAVSTSTGTVTITNNGVQTLTGSDYIAVNQSTGTVQITNNGVQTLIAGTDTTVSSSTGTVTIWNNSTLQSVTDKGSASSNAIQFTNTTPSTSISTGAVVVSGGVGIGGDLYIGGITSFANTVTVSTTLTLNGVTQNLGSNVTTSTVNLAYGATTSGNTKTVNIGTGGQAGSITRVNIGSFSNSSATINGSLVVGGKVFMQDTLVLLPVTTATAATVTGTATGATVYFTDIVPPKMGIYGSNAWRDAIGNILF